MKPPKGRPVLVFDFGGTKLAAGVVDADRGRVLAFVRIPTPASQGASGSIDAIVQSGRQALETAGVGLDELHGGIGISFGGPVSKDRRTVLRSMHVEGWDSIDLSDRIAAHFDRPAFMDNDANAAALGEWAYGAGKGAENLLYVQISTGIGAGLIVQRKVYRGSGLAGELGHSTVLVDGPLCSCGKRGCLESLAAGWAIAREGRALLENGGSSRLAELSDHRPERMDAELVLRASQEGDPGSLAVVERAFRYLAMGIANAICLLDPDVVVIGGGVSRSRSVVRAILEPELEESLPAMFRGRVRLAFSELEGLETLLGAALLAQGY
jgi:glucokinase